ncbi:unnamed protein product (macronuclear) [Paramecium tetraurelia]|uniref:Uncharacterized protein n=2 Tax=Paramecium TaxID=5884 RepID=A0DSJ0_PARTE|nr:uncharacterized protein GSPATT00019711001 [Paramecium tetraurelia]CAD8181283.1 unnamed protein product [Paramecium octaurelia]CAK86007.1 unnamed protein product [Paramecium tetraurelia]|eukprot:XP_001453404.1 hypothetical protein (macronuclear) [Paramecium tetraurelia strain d4-2]
MQQYFIDKDKSIWILLAQHVKDQQAFNKEIGLNENCIYALVNPEYLVSLQACLIAIYRMLKKKEYNVSSQFQRDLHYLLTPECQRNDIRFGITNILTQKMLCIFLTPVSEEQLNSFELDELTNLYQYCNIPQMIKYYKISDEELKVDKDVRGAVYNSIALKKFK